MNKAAKYAEFRELRLKVPKSSVRCASFDVVKIAFRCQRLLLVATLLFISSLYSTAQAASTISLSSCSSVPGSFHKRGLRALVDPDARTIFVYDRSVAASTGWGALGRLFGVVSTKCSISCASGHVNIRKSRLGRRSFRNSLSPTGQARTNNFPRSNPTTSYSRLVNRGFRVWHVSCQQNSGGGAAPGPSASQAADPAPAAPAAPDPAPAAPDPAPSAPSEPSEPDDGDDGPEGE